MFSVQQGVLVGSLRMALVALSLLVLVACGGGGGGGGAKAPADDDWFYDALG